MTRRASTRAAALPVEAPRLRPRPIRRRDPLELAVLGATALLEVRAGGRDATQLDDLVDARVARRLAALVRRRRRVPGRTVSPTLRRLVVDASRADRVNVVVLLDCRTRVVPVCVEVTRRSGEWHITSLATPADHVPDHADVTDRPDWEVPASVEPW